SQRNPPPALSLPRIPPLSTVPRRNTLRPHVANPSRNHSSSGRRHLAPEAPLRPHAADPSPLGHRCAASPVAPSGTAV
ncbi:Os01g0599550, partial [Oryza sativa Japonica Group]